MRKIAFAFAFAGALLTTAVANSASSVEGTYVGWVQQHNGGQAFYANYIVSNARGDTASVKDAYGNVYQDVVVSGNVVTFKSNAGAYRWVDNKLTVKGGTADFFGTNVGTGQTSSATLQRQ